MVQCYVKKKFKPTFKFDKLPNLLYVCKAEANHTKLPCVMHMHTDRLEILFVREGRGIHTIGGRQYNTQKGDILIYNSGVIHDERTNPDEKMSIFSCAVSNLKFENLRENSLLPEDATPILRSGPLAEDIENLFRMMHTQIFSGNTGAEEICHYMLLSLITLILNQIDRNVDVKEDENDLAVNHIKKYIDEHYSEELTLEGISETLNVSLSYLCHIFKETTGYAPIQYIMRRRVGEAQSLLISTQYSATEISSIVGYANSNYFNTIFTRIVGMSPIKYRKCWVDGDHGNFIEDKSLT